MTPKIAGCDDLIIASVSHARGMVLNASDVRMRNFNFFVILVGVLITGYSQLDLWWAPTVMGLLGFTAGTLFFVLDLRGWEFLDRANTQLRMAESELWERAGFPAVPPLSGIDKTQVISHRFVYRFFYVTVAVSSMVIVLATMFSR